MSDLDERLARWKAQTETLQTPPELKERLKQTTSSSAAAKGALSGAVKAGGLVVLALVVAVGVRFWPRHVEVEKPVAPVPVSVELAPPSALVAVPAPAGDTPVAAVPGPNPLGVDPKPAFAPSGKPAGNAGTLAPPPVLKVPADAKVSGTVPVQMMRPRPSGDPAHDAGPRPLP